MGGVKRPASERNPMKRTGFKQKLTKPLKRSKLRKKGKQKISVLKRKLWETFSKYIRERDKYTCFTCGRKGEGSGMHAGHFISKAIGGVELFFHEENVHAQCYNCNINLGGNQWIYGQRLGKETVDKLYEIKNKVISKWTEDDYINKQNYYGNLLLQK